MGNKYAEIAFTPAVCQVQEAQGSRAAFAAREGGADHHHLLGEDEAQFIGARDSFYMASVGETGWPYIQHRGGPAGFVRILDERTLGFADFSGNRQYVSVGNIGANDRVALFFMDYPNRTRLKLLGRARIIERRSPILSQLRVSGYRAEPERGILISVVGFDWNCPQHITPRYTEAQIRDLLMPPGAAPP